LDHSEADNQYAQWLLEIGAGSTINNNEMIQVPQSMVCTNLNTLINRIFPGIGNPRVQDDCHKLYSDHNLTDFDDINSYQKLLKRPFKTVLKISQEQ